MIATWHDARIQKGNNGPGPEKHTNAVPPKP